ncbi:hypothetical protein [Nonomuraea sp. SYSU D8015]|uniref:hypothetical protein n=1 Tax=Nonomuraea sp. SYSU D8015 TaxID=2593644 RepID=UPI001660620F|nr:hypothetical protein [Nonomuraea sp. SYSU D8015]
MTLRLLALLALVASVLVSTSTAAHACSCSDLTPAKAMGYADAVFTGTVAEVRARAADAFGASRPIVYTFRADTVYKGAAAAEFTVATNPDSASCEYAFEKGARYLVFADSDLSGLVEKVPGVSLASSLCAGNVPVDPGSGPLEPGDERTAGHESLAGPVDAELVEALGAPRSVRELPAGTGSATTRPGAAARETGSGWSWPVGGAVVVLTLALTTGLALIAGRRRAAARRG